MHERIRKLRKHLDLTQQEFADRLSVKRGAIANYEIGRNEPTDAVISLICREFNVNEEWLRNGTGEMFVELDKEDLLMEWAGRVLGSDSASFKKRFVKMLMSLSESEWEFLERKAKELVDYDDEA
jgi:transcriptional regulator with XRE-family HTH domain